jgi:hypothetical protein
MQLSIILIEAFMWSIALQTKASPFEAFLATQFEIITSTDEFPISVDDDRIMANPGGSWEQTDVVEDKNLPSQCLIFAGRSDSLWFVYYEQGGFGYSTNLIIFKPIPRGFQTLWVGWIVVDKVESIQELKQLVSTIPRSRLSAVVGKHKPLNGTIVEMPILEHNIRMQHRK